MGYFSDSYKDFRYPLAEGTQPGFRKAQLGAIHSIAGHFANRKDSAIVTMPTGSGKTAVLISAAYVLRGSRVLIITPSRLVREQIAEAVKTLRDLKGVGALPVDHPSPKVATVGQRVRSDAEWEELREFDVVVATVQSISPSFDEIPDPPGDLFDIVLVDEAHHSPATTWHTVLTSFPDAKRVLFTATPFRQDQREIKGRFVFTYDLNDAFKDGIFGTIAYKPVTPAAGESHDEAIALAAQQQFESDRAAGLQHRLMVRTDGVPRAKELFGLYQRVTNLRLVVITGNSSLKSVKTTIEKLERAELDGIICVNMLGEGFNFPSLKIAAIHAPHKSLNITLQFVGRFARTVGHNLGSATFLAVPSDLEVEAERLYDSRSVWQEMIQNLAALRVNEEVETREVLQSFEDVSSAPDLSDLSLYVLEPFYHVKVYQLDADISVDDEVKFPRQLQVAYRGISSSHNAAVYITREITQPRWTTDDRLSCRTTDLFIFYYDRETKLLFICATRRAASLYDELIEPFAAANPRPLPLVRLNRALNDLTSTEFFNIGMRNRVQSSTTESYRIIAGPSADKSVLKSDARLYHRGHAFGRAIDNGDSVTIGLSSASKIWSNKSSKLPELIAWCGKLARRINSDRTPITHSGLDYLDPGEELEALPQDVIAVDWPVNVYRNPATFKVTYAGTEMKFPATDTTLSIESVTAGNIVVTLSYNTIVYRFTFSFQTDRYFEPLDDRQPDIVVESDRSCVSVIEFINEHPPLFYTSDLSLIDGNNIFRVPNEPSIPFDVRTVEVVDWDAAQVNIGREFGDAGTGRISIHGYLEQRLQNGTANVVYYDHGTGEIADFVSIEQIGERVRICLYHCKKAHGGTRGARLDDINELTAQAVKSVTWASKQAILESIRRRFTGNIGGHRFVRGDLQALENLFNTTPPASIDYEFVAVQPGLGKDLINIEISNLLAAASDYLIRGGFMPLRVMSS